MTSQYADREVERRTFIQLAVVAGAAVSVVSAISSASLPEPFPWFELCLTVAAAAATRQFGLPLPGRGFASFVLGVVLFAVLRHGWAWGTLIAVLGMPVGDLSLRRLRVRCGARQRPATWRRGR